MVIVDTELERVMIDTWMQGVPSVERDPLAVRYERGDIAWPNPPRTVMRMGSAGGLKQPMKMERSNSFFRPMVTS